MKDIPEIEARSLLAESTDCIDIGDWQPSRHSGGIFSVECGLLKNGVYTQLHLELIHSYHAKTKVTHLKFSVFKKTPYGRDRVFQLDINQNPKAFKNVHNRPHCHWGNKKVYGDENWLTWSYDDAITYLIEQTKVRFDPLPTLPSFELR
jgi:hypothetical protein